MSNPEQRVRNLELDLDGAKSDKNKAKKKSPEWREADFRVKSLKAALRVAKAAVRKKNG